MPDSLLTGKPSPYDQHQGQLSLSYPVVGKLSTGLYGLSYGNERLPFAGGVGNTVRSHMAGDAL